MPFLCASYIGENWGGGLSESGSHLFQESQELPICLPLQVLTPGRERKGQVLCANLVQLDTPSSELFCQMLTATPFKKASYILGSGSRREEVLTCCIWPNCFDYARLSLSLRSHPLHMHASNDEGTHYNH